MLPVKEIIKDPRLAPRPGHPLKEEVRDAFVKMVLGLAPVTKLN